MIPAQNVKTILLPPIVTTAGSSHDMSFDTIGFDYCVIDVIQGTHDTAAYQLQEVVVSESDTITSATSQTQIVALSSSQATTASHAYAIPTLAATSIGSVLTIQFDLKDRKRYVGLYLLAHATDPSAVVCAVARLTRGEESPITAAQHDGENLEHTSASGCIGIVN